MLDFTTQKKLLEPIMKNPSNQHCADCNSVAPTWVSLDFGVFLCSNCSGAHRSLGPTITRVRSANLDKWKEEWIDNMRIGNQQLNLYWEGNASCAEKKPNGNSSLNDIHRYVYEKYIKRKWVADHAQKDPLTQYKNGQYALSKDTHKKQPQPVKTQQKQVEAPKKPAPVRQTPVVTPKQDLLDFDFDTPASTPNAHQYMTAPTPSTHQEEEEEFTQFTQAVSTVAEQRRSQDNNLISFDALMNQQHQPQQQSQQPLHHPPQQHFQLDYNNYNRAQTQNMQMHHPYNAHLGHTNMVYQSHYQHPQMAHQRGNYMSMPHGYSQPMNGQYGGVTVMQQPGQFW